MGHTVAAVGDVDHTIAGGGVGQRLWAHMTEESKRWTSGLAGPRGSDSIWVCLTISPSLSSACLHLASS